MSGSLSFQYIPNNLRGPGVFWEISAANANVPQVNSNALLVGQMLSGGTATAGQAVLIAPGVLNANTMFGAGSMLSLMVQAFQAVNPLQTLYCLPLADASGGTQATITVTFGTVATNADVTANGTLSLYLCGQLVPTAVLAAQTNSTIASNVLTAINATPNLPFTAAVGSGGTANVLTLTARHKGVAAGDITVALNYLGAKNNEATPTGLTVTIGALTAGTQDPDLATPFASLGNTNYDYICMPYTGATQTGELATLMSDSSGRWSYISQAYGCAWSANKSTGYSGLATFGQTLNNQHLTILGVYGIPQPVYVCAAVYMAAGSQSLNADPSVPLGGAGDGVALPGLLAPQDTNIFSYSENNTLLYDGISPIFVENSGLVRVFRSITTYQLNGDNQPSTAYLNTNIGYQLQTFLRGLTIDLSSKFGRCKLAQNGFRNYFGSNTVTPQDVLNECIAYYNNNLNLVQNPQAFAANATAIIPNNQPSVVQLYLPIDLIGQLEIIEGLVNFTINT